MEITCPNCGQTCEVDEEPATGRHLLCPFCDMKFNYTPQNTTENDSNSIANTAETNVDAPTAKIQTTCPHCGAVYEVDAAYIGETATCGTCDNDFVVKAKHGHTAAVSGKESPKMLLAKAKAAVNTAQIKAIALWQSGMKGKFVVLEAAALLVLCGILCFCTNGNGSNSSLSKQEDVYVATSKSDQRLKQSQELRPSTSQLSKVDGEIEYTDGSVATIPYGITRVSKENFKSYDVDKILKIKLPNSVTDIEYGVFNKRDKLSCVVIPNSVTNIEKEAFSSCYALTSLTIPNSIVNIGEGVFSWCKSLTDITIPDSVKNIGKEAFERCGSLKKVFIPNSVTNIDEAAFRCCAITSIKIPNSITSIGDAFAGCSHLTSVAIPNSVTNIGAHAFRYCKALKSIAIPDSVTTIGESAFAGCTNLTGVTIPNSIIDIGDRAFEECNNLSIAILPNSITRIGSWVFSGCSNLTSVTIPKSVTCIDYRAFDRSGLKEMTIPNSVTNIGSSAFANCHNLKSVVMPDGEVSVGKGAFENCIILTNFRKSRGAMNVSPNAFKGCQRLANNGFIIIGGVLYHYTGKKGNVTIPNGVTIIEDDSFADCKDLTSVAIPVSVKKIKQTAFADCRGLIRIDVNKGNAYYKSENGMLLSKDGTFLVKGINVKNVAIPNTVKSIGKKAFYLCKKIENVAIPNSVTSIGEDAFGLCEEIENVAIPNSVTNIGKSAFTYCSRLENVTIPNSVISIGDRAFSMMTNLRSVKISEGVMHIGAFAFGGCPWLEKVTIPDSVTDIGERAFYGCISLKNVSMPEAYADIKDSSVFELCPCRSSHMDMRRVNVIDNIIGKDKSLMQYQDDAKKGDVRAQYYLGMYYFETKNMTEAAKWLLMAAEKGHAGAQFEIGWICAWIVAENRGMIGNGAFEVPVRWWRKAAAQGHFEAFTRLQGFR